MAETTTEQLIDDNQETVTEIDSDRKGLMQALGIKSVNTLKSWCELWGIEYKAEFTPGEVAKLKHVQHWVQVKKINLTQYKAMISGRKSDPEVREQDGRYTATEQAASQSNEVREAIEQRYGQTINTLSKPLAEAFWQRLDIAVMRELVTTAKRKETPLIESSLLACLSNEEQDTLFFLTSEDSEVPLLAGYVD